MFFASVRFVVFVRFWNSPSLSARPSKTLRRNEVTCASVQEAGSQGVHPAQGIPTHTPPNGVLSMQCQCNVTYVPLMTPSLQAS